MAGHGNLVSIPDEYLQSGNDIYCWVMFHEDGYENDARVWHMAKIPVSKRPRPVGTNIPEDELERYYDLLAQMEQQIAAMEAMTASYSNASAVANTLSPDAAATVNLSTNAQGNKLFTFGIPQGKIPAIAIGTVEAVAYNEEAEVNRTGTDLNPVFNFKLPRGVDGTGAVSTVDGNAPDTNHNAVSDKLGMFINDDGYMCQRIKIES